ncbi:MULTISPECIES: RluA family pseudouridine synthase [Enterococcus]|uniref:Pseudouridine synthase n=1 Tax=Enterococcus dispar ATCC 51266 TaxID=1139219 RepID=S0KLN2_9ENTE|nr:RluA family pseudouridine synthase [Enterococcus dispar]EOT40933.1 23S rRNA pseudouridine synthase D [Enterococcus dispar ATCC 51266]EOW86694.1 23S rRNA pseudouridine synthase D [Enterococcus dispar ATCC 51266]OJG39636.1 23S rRNA pseudouridine synthase D [Enterococcus dispar]WCG34278.1 RluA family pseudouridine synthase [Enterococcus dispar]
MEYTITLPTSQKEMTIRQLLEKEWLVPRKVRHFLRIRKNVRKNGEPVMFHELCCAGDRITLVIEPEDYTYQEVALGNAKKVVVLYEDDHLLVANKSAGIKTHPNQPTEKDTLLNDVAAYLAPKGQRPYVVHRLDKETSGVILFAKNPLVLPILGRLLEQKHIYRQYQAIVSGNLNHATTINKKIGRDRHDRRKRIIDEKNGQTAITHVTVFQAGKHSQIYCQLETGRTHQIRVHLKSIGHPIVGDPLYGKEQASRLMLHALKMHLEHPFTKEKLVITASPGLWA